MIVCSNCGEENPPKFRLCGFCGTPLQQAAPAQEFRKIVSILFCDLKGSTKFSWPVYSHDASTPARIEAAHLQALTAAGG